MKKGAFENGPDNTFFEKTDLLSAHKKAEEFLNGEEIKLEDFRRLYSQAAIERDLNYTRKKREKFKKPREDREENEKTEIYARILEAIILEESEVGEWLGKNAFSIKSSGFDDIKNGVDIIIEFQNEQDKTLRLGLDVTFCREADTKVEKTKNKIDQGELTKIKYFVTHEGKKGALSTLPRAVIGIDFKTLQELIPLWMNSKDRKKMDNHPIQMQILEEIRLQMTGLEEYARKIGKNNIANVFEKTNNKIEEIIKEKENSIDLPEDFNNDKVFSAIFEAVKRLAK